jgi:enterochelin esterase-like enzyme
MRKLGAIIVLSIVASALVVALALIAGIIVLARCPSGKAGERGRVEEHLTLNSTILGKPVEYSIYLPPDYRTSERHYPIIYMLHGGDDGEDADWFRFAKINVMLDRLIGSGDIPAVIVVTPDGRREAANRNYTYYMNDADGVFRWEDMFVQDFVPTIEKQYRAIGTEKARAIAGLSMGGYAALAYAMRHPELFVAAAALSAALRTDNQIVSMDQAGYDRRYGKAWGMGLVGVTRLNDRYRDYSVLDMVDALPLQNLKATPLYIDCGAEDRFFFDGNAILHEKLRDKGVTHAFMSRPGGHDWDYWRSGMEGAVRFVAGRLQR